MKSSSKRIAAYGSLMLGILLISSAAVAQLYGSNVAATQSQNVSVNNTGAAITADNTAQTGVSITITGLTQSNPAASLSVTTQSLTAPPANAPPPPSNTGAGVYASITISAHDVDSQNAGKAQVCITNSKVGSGFNLYLYVAPKSGGSGSWVEGSNPVVTGTQICATFSFTDLLDPLMLAAPAAAPDYTWLYVSLIVVIIIIVGEAIWMMRRKKGP